MSFKKNRHSFYDKYHRYIIAMGLAMVPVIIFALTMIYDGVGLFELSLPSWENDELIYYYQVTGILKHKIPLGYFGYSENTARFLTFGAWSPFLLFNYVVFGFVFGFSIIKAALYNLIFLSLAMFIFGISARPNLKQAGLISIFVFLYTYISNGLLSISPEISCYSYAIIFIGLCYSTCRESKRYKIIILYLIAVLLTLMRPYYLGFIVAAAYFHYKNVGKKSIKFSAFIVCITMALYCFVYKCLCAMPGGSLVKNSMKSSSSLPFFRKLIASVMKGFASVFSYVRLFFVEGNDYRNFFLFFCCLSISGVLSYGYYAKNKTIKKGNDGSEKITNSIKSMFFNRDSLLFVSFFTYLVFMLVAVVLLFSGWPADRHFAEFVVMAIFIFGMEFVDNNKASSIFALLLFLAVIIAPNGHRTYANSFEIEAYRYMKEEMENDLSISVNVPSFDNTVLWIFSDDKKQLNWKMLFAFPDGYGFNMGKENWFLEQNNIQSRFVATVPGGETEQKCIDLGGKKYKEYGGIVIYEMR